MNVAHLTVRIFQGRALLRVPSCASQKRGQTYKPRGNGKFKKKYSNRDEDECVEECIDDGRDVAVWNERTGSCYCWEERDGQWERDRSGDDNAFEIDNCQDDNTDNNRRNVEDKSEADPSEEERSEVPRPPPSEKEESETSEERSRSEEPPRNEAPRNERNSAVEAYESRGPGSFTAPDCVITENTGFFKLKSGVRISPPSYENLGNCYANCYRTYATIVWKFEEARCYCYQTADGWWDWPEWNEVTRDTSYDLLPCFQPPQGGQGMVTNQNQAQGNKFAGQGLVPPMNMNQGQVPGFGGPGIVPPMNMNQGQAIGFGGPGMVPPMNTNQGQVPGFGGQGAVPILPNQNQGQLNGFAGQSGNAVGQGNKFQQPAAGGIPAMLLNPGAAASLSGECGTAQWPLEWNINNGQKCTGAALKTVQPGNLAYVNSAAGFAQVPYDGSVAGCQLLFNFDYAGVLFNADIDLTQGSWMTWDASTGVCSLYRDNQACQGLETAGAQGQFVSLRYCP